MQRAGRGKQYLIQMRGEPHAGRILHGVHGAALLVGERLQAAQVKQGRSRRPAAGKSRGPNRAGGRHLYSQYVRMQFGGGIHAIEKRLTQTVSDSRASKSLVQKDGAVRNRFVKLLQSWMAMLFPLIGMPSAH